MSDAAAPDRTGGIGRWVSAAQIGGLASMGAGAIHAAAAGVHAEHATLSRLFVVTAVLPTPGPTPGPSPTAEAD